MRTCARIPPQLSWELHRGDVRWPLMLNDMPHEPETLYGMGNWEILQRPCISIIGARRATPYGLAIAKMAGRISAECNLVVVSGGAMGCDAAALRAARDAGGCICVVPGSGADVVYPASSRDVFEYAKTDRGCIVSLETWATPPRKYSFPKRNHIIAALSHVLIITEAAHKSGTMTTAEVAMNLGRTLYACPGSIFSPLSTGVNALISDGAAMICSKADLECRISMDYGCLRLIDAEEHEREGRMLAALIANPMRADELARALDEPIVSVLSALGDYEIQGLVKRMLDGRFSPTEQALMYNQKH